MWPETEEQLDWCHKMANVLDELPKRLQPKARQGLREMLYAATTNDAEESFDAFVDKFSPKHEKAVECLAKDRERLLSFFELPAEHWKHLRTTNPIAAQDRDEPETRISTGPKNGSRAHLVPNTICRLAFKRSDAGITRCGGPRNCSARVQEA